MKKLNFLLMLMVAAVFFGCEEGQLIEEELNVLQDEQAISQEQLYETKSTANGSNIAQKNGSMAGMDVETIESGGFQIYNPDELTVYVDYSEFFLSDDIISSNSTPMQIEQVIENYENEMGNNFTIYNIEKSNICLYVYKWTVDKEEYYSWNPPYSGSGNGKIKQKPEDPDDMAFPGDDLIIKPTNPYLECF